MRNSDHQPSTNSGFLKELVQRNAFNVAGETSARFHTKVRACIVRNAYINSLFFEPVRIYGSKGHGVAFTLQFESIQATFHALIGQSNPDLQTAEPANLQMIDAASLSQTPQPRPDLQNVKPAIDQIIDAAASLQTPQPHPDLKNAKPAIDQIIDAAASLQTSQPHSHLQITKPASGQIIDAVSLSQTPIPSVESALSILQGGQT